MTGIDKYQNRLKLDLKQLLRTVLIDDKIGNNINMKKDKYSVDNNSVKGIG